MSNAVGIRNYHAILEDFGALSYGLAGMVDNGIGVVPDGASEVVLVPNLHRFAHGRSQPRHLLCASIEEYEAEYQQITE